MATKYIANINETYTAEAVEYSGNYSVDVLKEGEVVHSVNVAVYNLRDASTWIRKYLNMKGKRITWKEAGAE